MEFEFQAQFLLSEKEMESKIGSRMMMWHDSIPLFLCLVKGTEGIWQIMMGWQGYNKEERFYFFFILPSKKESQKNWYGINIISHDPNLLFMIPAA